MKKYLNNRVYDTEKSEEIGYFENIEYRNDVSWFGETLYRKKTGEFFLHGIGNAASKYRKYVGFDSFSGDEIIIPIDYKTAEEWAKKYLSPEKYDEIFGEITADSENKIVTISISKSTHEKIKRNAQRKGISVSKYIEQLIENDK